jgi:putative glutamine amidotransferase
VPDALAHEQPNPRTEPGHEVALTPGTLLSRIVGAPAMAVNSAHHQAVDRPGEGAVVNARAPDGVVEGLEHPGYRFCLGVQWHPEYAVDPRDQAILDAFVEAARHTSQERVAT